MPVESNLSMSRRLKLRSTLSLQLDFTTFTDGKICEALMKHSSESPHELGESGASPPASCSFVVSPKCQISKKVRRFSQLNDASSLIQRRQTVESTPSERLHSRSEEVCLKQSNMLLDKYPSGCKMRPYFLPQRGCIAEYRRAQVRAD